MSSVLSLLLGCTGEPTPTCGEGRVCTVIGTGVNAFDGDGRDALDTSLYYPTTVALHPDGRLVVVDFNNMRVRARQPDGTVATLAGDGGHGYSTPGRPPLETSFENPSDVAFRADGTFYVMAQHEQRVLYVEPTAVSVYAGNGDEGWGGDGGPARDAVFSEAASIALADDGTLYVADTANACIRAVTVGGTVEAVADGFQRPQHIRWAEGALWIADAGHNQIIRLDPASGAREVIAGSGLSGYSGDGGDARDATLSEPWGVAVVDGEVWIADSGNEAIRRVGVDGVIETMAGGREGYVDGPAEDAAFCFPTDVAPGDGGLYVADYCNGAVRQLR